MTTITRKPDTVVTPPKSKTEIREEVRAQHPLLNGSTGRVYGHDLLQKQYGHQTEAGGWATYAMGATLDIDLQHTMRDVAARAGDGLALWHDDRISESRGATGSTAVLAETPFPVLEETVRLAVPADPQHPAKIQNFTGFNETFDGQPVSIEVKSQQAAEELIEAIKADPELLDRVELFAFNGEFTKAMRDELGPRAVTGMSQTGAKLFYLFSKVPLLARLFKFPTDSYVVALPANLRQVVNENKLLTFLDKHAGAVGDAILDHTLLKESTVRAAEKSGLKLTAWTVNDPQLANELLEAGVHMIYTDDAGVAKVAVDFSKGNQGPKQAS